MTAQAVGQSTDRQIGPLILFEPCPRCKGQQTPERDAEYGFNYTVCLNCGYVAYGEEIERKEEGKRGIAYRFENPRRRPG